MLAGGAGEDVFEFKKKDGEGDRITDFADGEDRIRIRSGADAFSDLDISGGANARVAFAQVEIILEGVAASALSAEDFLFG